jgi:hypothetical protein
MKNLTCKILLPTFISLCIIIATGCGGGGGGDSVNAVDLKPGFCAGFKYQESGGKKNIILAVINRAGVSGHIENSTGTTLPGSNLVSNSQANTSEIMVEATLAGTYKFVYYIGSERFEVTRDIQWTTIPDFTSVPQTPFWTSPSQLSVTYSAINAGNASYYLRLFYAESLNTMYQQTSSSPGGGVLTMNVNVTGNFVPVLIADAYENDQLSSTVRYIFNPISR